MRLGWLLTLAAVCVFAIAATILVKVMPAPLKDSDYLVIGSVATLASLLVVFLALISTRMRSSDVFVKKRKKR